MFRFVELTLQNWDYFGNVRVPLDGEVVLVTGPNGSGKTTFIDAMRQLVGAGRLSSRRHTEHYVRDPARFPLITAVVSNTAENGSSRPFVRERITSDEATLACAVVTSRGGELERRYAIRQGRTSVAELHEILLESRDGFYTPEPYQRALRNAGLSRSMLHVIALEQGRTNALFESSPRELFERVIDIRGDREILDRYRDARRRYEDTTRELTDQIAALHRKREELDQIKREVARLDDWIAARDSVDNLKALLPAARLQEKLRRKREFRSQIKSLQSREGTIENEMTLFERRLKELRATEASARKELDSAIHEEKQAQGIRDASVDARAHAQAEVDEIEKEAALAALGPSEGALSDLEGEAEEAAHAQYRAESEREQLAARVERAQQRLEQLAAGLAAYPDAVVRTLAELHDRNIPAGLVADTIEIERSELGEAVESALGQARYGLVVSPEHFATAISVARDLEFPGPVYSGPRIDQTTVAGSLVLQSGAPSWLQSWPDTVELHEDGSWNNNQGVWVTGVMERVIGKSGRQAAIDRTEHEIYDAQLALSASLAELEFARSRREKTRDALKREEHRREYSEEIGHLFGARQRVETAEISVIEAERKLSETRTRLALARERHGMTGADLKSMELECANAETTLKTIHNELEDRRVEATEIDAAGAELDVTVRPELRARAERGDLAAADTVEHDYKKAMIRFESLGAPPAEAVRDEERVLRANVEEAERHVKQREHEAKEARDQLEICRVRFLEVVNQTLIDYRRRIRQVSEIAGVDSEVDIPNLVNDDRLLDEAKIGVRFGFDNKEPLPLALKRK